MAKVLSSLLQEINDLYGKIAAIERADSGFMRNRDRLHRLESQRAANFLAKSPPEQSQLRSPTVLMRRLIEELDSFKSNPEYVRLTHALAIRKEQFALGYYVLQTTPHAPPAPLSLAQKLQSGIDTTRHRPARAEINQFLEPVIASTRNSLYRAAPVMLLGDIFDDQGQFIEKGSEHLHRLLQAQIIRFFFPDEDVESVRSSRPEHQDIHLGFVAYNQAQYFFVECHLLHDSMVYNIINFRQMTQQMPWRIKRTIDAAATALGRPAVVNFFTVSDSVIEDCPYRAVVALLQFVGLGHYPLAQARAATSDVNMLAAMRGLFARAVLRDAADSVGMSICRAEGAASQVETDMDLLRAKTDTLIPPGTSLTQKESSAKRKSADAAEAGAGNYTSQAYGLNKRR